MLQNSMTDYVWLHRIKKLLNICIQQLSVPVGAQTLPLRLLETLTSVSFIERHVENEQLIQYYLERIFTFLVKDNYYKHLRRLLELKCPPLDCECLRAPNPFVEALMQLVLRPLLLNAANDAHIATIYGGFVRHILSAPFSEAVRFFLIPGLAEQPEFPFERLVSTLSIWIKQDEGGGGGGGQRSSSRATTLMVEPMVISMAHDAPNNSKDMASTASSVTSNYSNSATRSSFSQTVVPFNGFLLESLLILDRNKLGKLIGSFWRK